ncbi:putative metallopeptidase domain protein [Raoultella phage Ro1]|uniref:Putative metallopeptidase domain protein n=1 Tax=Raoultella phage Ro1 TaxID=2053702 RepID=A0A2H4YGZ9_9CAUD|nr:HNH endonuclease [Raoultella phage Ro1]AUE23255.1 putative metallopeptidase domain protein [Raoultella phage Ro1]
MYKDESEMISKLQDSALKKVQSARIALLTNRPFYGTLLSGMPLIVDCSWLPTAATDHRNLYFNPEFIMGMPADRKKKVFARIDKHPMMTQQQKDDYKEYINVFYRQKTMKEIVFIMMHEVRHVTNDHMSRGKTFDRKRFNIAADHYINTDLVKELGQKAESLKWFTHRQVFDKTKEFGFLAYCYCDYQYEGKTAEEIYALLPEEIGDGEGKPLGAHIGDYDKDLDILGYTDPHPQKSADQEDEDMSWSEDMIDAAMKAAGGEGPKEARELIAQKGKPKINYLQIIKQRMISRVKSDRTYRVLGRRSGGMTKVLRDHGALTKKQFMVMPGRKRTETVDIVIGFDVSGSISRQTMTRIFNEIIALSTLYQCFRITLFCWSTQVGNVNVYTQDNIKEILDYRVTSTGGTTAACAFEYIDEFIPKAKEVIIFTDGYIEDLRHRGSSWGRKYNTLWVICGGRKGWIPPFGKAVDLDEHFK